MCNSSDKVEGRVIRVGRVTLWGKILFKNGNSVIMQRRIKL